jgi:hypothetical protein
MKGRCCLAKATGKQTKIQHYQTQEEKNTLQNDPGFPAAAMLEFLLQHQPRGRRFTWQTRTADDASLITPTSVVGIIIVGNGNGNGLFTHLDLVTPQSHSFRELR